MKRQLLALAVIPLLSLAARDDGDVRLEVVRDNSIVLYAGEEHVNAGSAERIRIQGNQHLVALAFDTRPIRGKVVTSASLVCVPGAHRIAGLTISTIQADWDEERSNALTSGALNHAGWAWPGARFPAVTGSNAFSLVCQASARSSTGREGWGDFGG